MKHKSNKNSSNNKTKELFNKIIEGVNDIVKSGSYAQFLKFCKNFHGYSFNNMVLIFLQMPEATRVAGFKTWEKMGRRLKKGAKGILIVYPIKKKRVVKLENQESLLEDEAQKEEKTIEYMRYGYTYVYDISQTVGEETPFEDTRINSSNMEGFLEFLKSFSPYPVKEEKIYGGTKGYWSPQDKQIVLKTELSIDDKVSVLLHELTHALYDDFDYHKDRNLSETFVESVAFIVADYFGLDTSECSFNYITSWAGGDIKVVLELGDKIQKTANQFIKQIEEYQEQNLKIIA